MLKAILRRIALSVLTLFLVALLVFLATEVLPGDALDVMLTDEDLQTMTADQIAEKRSELGLDRPAPIRFLSWLRGALVLDFGVTFIDKAPIFELIRDPMLNSLQLGVVITLLTAPVALAVGISSGYWRGRRADGVVSTTAIVGYSIPDFVIGTVLILAFAIWLPIFPARILVFSDATWHELLAVSLLPAAAVTIGHVAHLGRLLRAGFIEALNSEFVERARLAGLSEASVVFRHALAAAVIPTLNSFALYVAGILNGLIVIEKVFGYPGLGLELIDAVNKREVHVVQAITFLAALLVIAMNLLADLAIILLDPRVRSHARD